MKTCKLLQRLVLAGILMTWSAILWAQQAKNVALADFIRTEDLYQQSSFPYNTATLAVGDIWGWSYSSDEYALICLASKNVTGSGLAMVQFTALNRLQIIKLLASQMD